MTVDIRRARPDDLAAIVALDARNFGLTINPADDDIAGELLDLDRFLLATDDGRPVAAAGSYQLELTVPGNGILPLSGVTWVSVAASHRRQGILRRLMDGLDELADEFEEPILGLSASEGPIYERFGYGIATRARIVEIDRRRVTIDPRWSPEPVELIDASDHVEELLAIHDRYRRTHPGEVSRSEALFRDNVLRANRPNFAALHPDGYAVYDIEPNWDNGHPAHVLTVKDCIAVTPEAHLALWNLLLSVDLVGPVRSHRGVAVDDPLPALLTDQRAVRTTDLNDDLWLKVADPARCFAARSYRTDDRLVIGVVDDPHQLEGGPGGGRPDLVVAVGPGGCQVTDLPVELVAHRAALGPLLLGVSASRLAAARRIAAAPDVVERADLLLGTGRASHCRTVF